MNLADALIPKHFPDGAQIIKQGDIADGMYFVEQGVIKITILNEQGREVEVSRTLHWKNVVDLNGKTKIYPCITLG